VGRRDNGWIVIPIILVLVVLAVLFIKPPFPQPYVPSVTFISSQTAQIPLTSNQTSSLIVLTVTKTDNANVSTSFIVDYTIIPAGSNALIIKNDYGQQISQCNISPLVHEGAHGNCEFTITALSPSSLSASYLINATLEYNGSVMTNVHPNPISFNVTVKRS